MSESVVFPAIARERAGKGAARAIRREGRVPGVVYGGGKDPVMISVDPQDLNIQLHKAGFYSTVFEVEVDGKKEKTLARDVQFHPVTDRPLHVDFMRLAKGATVTVHVETVFENELASPGIKRGGVLNIVRHDVELVCPADSIPEKLVFDLTGMDLNDSLHISAIELPEGVRPTITDRDFTVATIAAPSGLKSEASEAEEGEEGEEAAAEE